MRVVPVTRPGPNRAPTRSGDAPRASRRRAVSTCALFMCSLKGIADLITTDVRREWVPGVVGARELFGIDYRTFVKAAAGEGIRSVAAPGRPGRLYNAADVARVKAALLAQAGAPAAGNEV